MGASFPTSEACHTGSHYPSFFSTAPAAEFPRSGRGRGPAEDVDEAGNGTAPRAPSGNGTFWVSLHQKSP